MDIWEEMYEKARAEYRPEDISPFMNMAFVSLTVIPHLKMTTFGLCDVATQTILPLAAEK